MRCSAIICVGSCEKRIGNTKTCWTITNNHYLIAFNYMDKEQQPYEVIEKAVCKALKKINNHQ